MWAEHLFNWRLLNLAVHRVSVPCFRSESAGRSRLLRKATSSDQESANLDSVGVIHVKHIEGRPSDGGLASQHWSVSCEVAVPSLAARVQQSGELSGLRVYPRDVRAFVKVVVHAREGEILVSRLATMLLGDDVIEGECEIRDIGGILQYSQRFFARCRTRLSRDSLIRSWLTVSGRFAQERGSRAPSKSRACYPPERTPRVPRVRPR